MISPGPLGPIPFLEALGQLGAGGLLLALEGGSPLGWQVSVLHSQAKVKTGHLVHEPLNVKVTLRVGFDLDHPFLGEPVLGDLPILWVLPKVGFLWR